MISFCLRSRLLRLDGCIATYTGRITPELRQKKPTWLNTLEVLNHVGLLFNEPPDTAGLLFV
jgi:hypothetical protein